MNKYGQKALIRMGEMGIGWRMVWKMVTKRERTREKNKKN